MSSLRVTWWGHATVEIEVDGVRVLTDPLLSARVGPLCSPYPPRPPAAPAPDVVVVSHLHPDHLDLPSLRRLAPTARLVVPAGAGAFVRAAVGAALGPGVEELARGEATTVGAVTIVATPARHGSRRYPLSRLSAPPLGFVVDGTARVYFAGDTDLFPEMAGIAPDLDIALLPVGGWGPTLGPGHLDPLRAAEALRLLAPRQAVPVHWGSLRLAGAWRLNRAAHSRPGEQFRQAAAEVAPEVAVEVLAPNGGALDIAARC